MVRNLHMPTDVAGVGTVLRWMKREGERFEKDEPLFEVDTRKTIIQVDAPESGTILRISAKEGAPVIAGSAVALYAAEGEEVPPELLKPPSPATLLIKPLDEEGKLLADANVSVDGQELALTADGVFMAGGLAPSAHNVMVKAVGFLDKILVLRLGEGETAMHELNLRSVASMRGKASENG